MARLFLASLLAWLIVFPVGAALKTGAEAPAFEAPAALAGKTFRFSIQDALTQGPVVLHFFPAAFTDACNLQVHAFAAEYEKFVAAGATVVGVSLDSLARLKAFSAEPDYCGGKVAVAADADGSIAKSYDLRVDEPPPGVTDTQGFPIRHGWVEPMTFVLAPDGTVAAAIATDSPTALVGRALEAVQRLAAKQLTKAVRSFSGVGREHRLGRNGTR